jgi:hypothetical protein
LSMLTLDIVNLSKLYCQSLGIHCQPEHREAAMHKLSLQRRTQIISCLVEGNSIRSTERMTETHRDTIMRLMVQVGTGCEKLLDEQMRNLACERLKVDEIWTYVEKKQAQVAPWEDKTRVGDQWTFVAIDADTKIVPAYRIGKRDLATARLFMNDLAERLDNNRGKLTRPIVIRCACGLRRRDQRGIW